MLNVKVRSEWVDYNGHMNDAAYAGVFSLALDQFMNEIGLVANFRTQNQFTIFTLETHICYLKEAFENEPIVVSTQIIDYDLKRLHLFFTMKNSDGEKLATSEQMIIGIDTTSRRSAPFPLSIRENIEKLASTDKEKSIPNEAGRAIGLKRKKPI